MQDKLEKLKELHTKVVQDLDAIDDKLLEDPLQDDLIDSRIRLRTLAAGISLDISLLEADIASDKALRGLRRYPYDGLTDEEDSSTLEDKFKPWEFGPDRGHSTFYVNHDNAWTDQTLVEAPVVTFLCKCTKCLQHAEHIRKLRRENRES